MFIESIQLFQDRRKDENMKAVQIFLGCLGRILISLIFILSGIGSAMDWSKSMQYLSAGLQLWASHASTMPHLLSSIAYAQSYASLLLGLAVAFQILGGLLVFFGFKTRFGAFLLFLFLVPVTVLMHSFWFVQGLDRDLQLVMFMKNLSILGAVFYLLAFGNGFPGKKAKTEVKEK